MKDILSTVAITIIAILFAGVIFLLIPSLFNPAFFGKEVIAAFMSGLAVAIAAAVAYSFYQHNRIERQAIFALFIPEFHNKFAPSYILLNTHAGRFYKKLFKKFTKYDEVELKSPNELSETDRENSFYDLIMFYKTLNDGLPISGLFFQHRVGEYVLNSIISSIVDIVRKNIDKKKLSQLLDFIEIKDKKGAFLKKLNIPYNPHDPHQFNSLFDNYKKWLESSQNNNELKKLGYLFYIFEKVMYYEVNEPYNLWYGESASYKFDKSMIDYLENEIIDELKGEVSEESIRAYMNKLKKHQESKLFGFN